MTTNEKSIETIIASVEKPASIDNDIKSYSGSDISDFEMIKVAETSDDNTIRSVQTTHVTATHNHLPVIYGHQLSQSAILPPINSTFLATYNQSNKIIKAPTKRDAIITFMYHMYSFSNITLTDYFVLFPEYYKVQLVTDVNPIIPINICEQFRWHAQNINNGPSVVYNYGVLTFGDYNVWLVNILHAGCFYWFCYNYKEKQWTKDGLDHIFKNWISWNTYINTNAAHIKLFHQVNEKCFGQYITNTDSLLISDTFINKHLYVLDNINNPTKALEEEAKMAEEKAVADARALIAKVVEESLAAEERALIAKVVEESLAAEAIALEKKQKKIKEFMEKTGLSTSDLESIIINLF